jgi:hypothetical protein
MSMLATLGMAMLGCKKPRRAWGRAGSGGWGGVVVVSLSWCLR